MVDSIKTLEEVPDHLIPYVRPFDASDNQDSYVDVGEPDGEASFARTISQDRALIHVTGGSYQ
jgi:hypothetical protein